MKKVVMALGLLLGFSLWAANDTPLLPALKLSNLTATQVVATDANKKLVSVAVTPTELLNVAGVTASLCGISQSCTLTNKTINGSNNTISNISLSSQVTGTLPLGNGGTGQTTKAAAFNALSPMTTSGDIIYGGASGTGTRLAAATDGWVLTLSGGLPVWQVVSSTAPPPNYQLSSACTFESSSNTSFTDVTNLSVTITTGGRPVLLKLISVSTGGNSELQIGDADSTKVTGRIAFVRDGSVISAHTAGAQFADAGANNFVRVPISSFSYFDTPSAGTYTYKVQAMVDNGTSGLTIQNTKLLAYEL